MDEDEDTRLVADNPGYPVADVPTQSSRTAEFSWVNNKITLGSKPVQTEKNRNSVNNNTRDEIDKENICKHCNIQFANNNLLIKHLFELLAGGKKPVKRKIEKAKSSEECQLSKKSKNNKNVTQMKNHSSASEEIFDVTSQSQIRPNISYNNEHSRKQTSTIDISCAANTISVENNNTGRTKDITYIYKCKECNTYFGNKLQMNQHKLNVHPDHKDIFVKLPTTNISKTNKPEHNELNEGKPKDPEECQLSSRSKFNDNIINVQENRNIRSQMQHESSTSDFEHSIQQTSSINGSSVSNNMSYKKITARISVENNKNTERLSTHLDHTQKSKMISAPKKERKNHKNKQVSTVKILSYGPEVTESLSMQNKAGPSCQQDTLNQAIANRINKKVLVSKTFHKKKPIKKINKGNLISRDQTHSPVTVINSETTELFKSDCGLHFISCKSLQKHSEECSGSCNTPKVNCKKCGYIFPLDTLGIHKSKHHNNTNSINIFDIVKLSQKRNVLQCTSCAQKFTYKKSYQTHVLQCKYKMKNQNLTTLKTLYKCSRCNLYYATRYGLKEHLKKNHLVRYAIKKCNECNILLSNRSFDHHVKIQHDALECKFKDLIIKYTDKKGKMQNKRKSSKIRTVKSVSRTISSSNYNSFSTTHITEGGTDAIKSNIRSTEKPKDISITSKINSELTYKRKAILPNVLYKCYKCEIHFLTSSAYKEHLSCKNCRDFIRSDIGKCPKCNLMFNTENVIEHLDNQHFDSSEIAKDFLIICNDTVEIQSHCKETGNISKEHTQPTKSSKNQNDSNEPVLQKTVYDKEESVKLFAEAWIRSKCTNEASLANIDITCFTNYLYRCPKCTLNYLNHTQLKSHVSDCKGDNSGRAQCPICCYSFDISSLSLHIYVHHAKMELKQENFMIGSTELPTNESVKKLVNENMQVQKESNHNQNLLNTNENENTRTPIAEAKKCIDSNTNSSDIIDLVSSLESINSERIDDNITEPVNSAKCDVNRKSPEIIDTLSLQETETIILSDFKSSRAKIAWAIDSIEVSNKIDPNKSPQGLNKDVKEYCSNDVTSKNKAVMDLSNDTIKQLSTQTDKTSCEVENDVSEEIDSILSALDGNTKELTNVDSISCSPNKITDTGEDVQTNTVFENIDTLVASFDKNTKNSKQQKQTIMLYKCNICCIHFMTPKSLQIHITNGVHNEELGTNCNICHLTFNKYTVAKHITKHHKKMNMTPFNYIIKTNYRANLRIKKQQVESDFFKKNQHDKNILNYANDMLGLTRKQKLSLCKMLKKTNQNTAMTETSASSNQIQNLLLKELLNRRYINETHQDMHNISVNKRLIQQDQESNKGEISTNSNNSTLAHTSIPNLDIIDLSNSQDYEVGESTVTDPVPLQSTCTKTAQSPNKRKFSVDSNITNIKSTTPKTITRTKSVNQRESQSYNDVITNQSFDSGEIVRVNINTSLHNKNDKNITIVTNNGNGSNDNSELMPAHYRLNGVDIVPVNANISADIYSKKHNSVVQSRTTKSTPDKSKSVANSYSIDMPDKYNTLHAVSVPSSLTISRVATEHQNQNQSKNASPEPKKQSVNNMLRQRTMSEATTPSKDMDIILTGTTVPDVLSKQNGQNSKSFNLENPGATDSSCIPGTSRRSLITFEDSDLEIRTTYEKDKNANATVAEKRYTEELVKQKLKLKRQSQDSKRDSNSSSSTTTPSRRASSNILRNDSIDIIDITEETNDNSIRVPEMNRTKRISSEPSKSKAPNVGVEKNMGASDYGHNIHTPASTIGAGASNTPMTFPPTPVFNLLNLVNNPLYNLLSLPSYQQYGLNMNQNWITTTPKQSGKRSKKPSKTSDPSIYDRMQSCPICRASNAISSVKTHLRIKCGFFSCCFCARRSSEMELDKHIQICGSQINFNSYT